MLTGVPIQSLADVIDIGPVGPDDMSDVRYIQPRHFGCRRDRICH